MMRIMMRQIPALVLVAAALTGCAGGDKPAADPPSGAIASAAAPSMAVAARPADAGAWNDAALQRFRLSTDEVAKATQASRNLAQLNTTDPQLLQRLDHDAPLDDAKSIQEMADRLDKIPQVRRAIESAGISTRDYVLVLFTVTQVAVANVYAQQGKMKELPANISRANVAFATAHATEMARLQQAMEQMSPADHDGNGTTP
jgi:hypothetical protein